MIYIVWILLSALILGIAYEKEQEWLMPVSIVSLIVAIFMGVMHIEGLI